MENLINFITGGTEIFTPSVIVGLIVFMLILDALTMLLAAFVGGLKK